MRSFAKALGEDACFAAKESSITPPIYPVVLCGGAGARLWPVSRPWRPKPFLSLTGGRSGFQDAVLRAAALAEDGGEVAVLGAAAHASIITRQLSEAQAAATVLLEPEGRDTAAAVAAAAAWAASRHAGAVVAILPADHHVPNATAFQDAVRTACDAAAADGVIVALGLRPQSASTAFGYIQPGPGGAVRPIGAFIEKPPAEQAEALLEQGALWNSGVFVATAATLLAETRRRAPAVAAAAEQAVRDASGPGNVLHLGRAFAAAPSIAFDRAVMERTDRGAVLAADFAWSDLGAWDAVLAASPRDPAGNSLAGDVRATGSAQVLVRAAAGMRVAVVGASRLAVLAEPDAVLVCALGHDQDVRGVASGPPRRFGDLGEACRAYDGWLRTAALPLWATVGVDPATGGFREALTWDGEPHDPRRRTRVQARQAFVYASAAADGVPGPWLRTAREGFGFFLRHARREDGLFAACMDLQGEQTDPEARIYEHAFVLLALAALHQADPEAADAAEAAALRDRLESFRHGAGGFREADPEPFQANAHMHLFEAALAWEEVGGDGAWAALADELAELALGRFISGETGALREFFDADWRPLTGEGGLIEPGHQFEWAWLLERWGRARGEARARTAARRLFEVGRGGFDAERGVVVNALADDLSVRDAGARLWPQTEHLKAALILGEDAAALEAANGLHAYLETPARGVWRERMRADGGFLEEPSPATSLYHLFVAMRELAQAAGEPC